MAPQELASRINLGLAMLNAHAISLESFRRDYANVENPSAENRQVIAEMVYMDPEVIKNLIPLALSETGKDMLLKLWEMVQQQMPMPGSPAEAGGPPGAPQGPPGGPGQPPAPAGGVIPPQMQGQGGGAFDPILALLMGGAQGPPGANAPPLPPGLL